MCGKVLLTECMLRESRDVRQSRLCVAVINQDLYIHRGFALQRWEIMDGNVLEEQLNKYISPLSPVWPTMPLACTYAKYTHKTHSTCRGNVNTIKRM